MKTCGGCDWYKPLCTDEAAGQCEADVLEVTRTDYPAERCECYKPKDLDIPSPRELAEMMGCTVSIKVTNEYGGLEDGLRECWILPEGSDSSF